MIWFHEYFSRLGKTDAVKIFANSNGFTDNLGFFMKNHIISRYSTSFAGTHGRVCDKNSRGPDGCKAMCCDRGFETIQTQIKERCKCKFHWCCYVECKTCTKDVELTVCK